MARITKINHIAIAVSNSDEALKFWRDALGLEPHHIEIVPSQKAEVTFIPVGENEIELVKPTEEGTGVDRFLKERGGGMHHICLEVDHIEEMLINLQSKGVRLINETPIELEGRKMAFIHPRSSNGVLVELYEITR